MLSEISIKELAIKLQTTEVNILREYFQHLFLSNLYQLKLTDNLAFKGGTALRMIYGSPRFSEDLDFIGNIKIFHLKNILNKTVEKIKLEGINISISEAKKISSGFLAIYESKIYSLIIRCELNISMRQKQKKYLLKSIL